MRNLLGLGLEVLVLLVCDHEIEHGDAALDEIKFVDPAIAKVFILDRVIEPPREQVMQRAALRETLGAGVPQALDLAPEAGRPLAPMRSGASEKLAGGEVARIGGCQVEETRFGLGVAEGLQSVDVCGCDVHRVRISCVSSRSSRMRRRRDASSARP